MNVNFFVLLGAVTTPIVVYTLSDKIVSPNVKEKRKLKKIDEMLAEMRLASSVPISEYINSVEESDIIDYFKLFGVDPYKMTYNEMIDAGSLFSFMLSTIAAGTGIQLTYGLLHKRGVLSDKMKNVFQESIVAYIKYLYNEELSGTRVAKRGSLIIPFIMEKLLTTPIPDMALIMDTEKFAHSIETHWRRR